MLTGIFHFSVKRCKKLLGNAKYCEGNFGTRFLCFGMGLGFNWSRVFYMYIKIRFRKTKFWNYIFRVECNVIKNQSIIECLLMID